MLEDDKFPFGMAEPGRCELLVSRKSNENKGTRQLFSASPATGFRLSPRLVWPNQPALKHAGDKAGRDLGLHLSRKVLGVAANGPCGYFWGVKHLDLGL